MSAIEVPDLKIPFKFRTEIHKEKLNSLYKWIYSTPKNNTYRVNLLKTTVEQVIEHLNKELEQKYGKRVPTITTFPHLSEVITVHSWDESIKLDLSRRSTEIIVDAICGSAVLRGAHVFAPGILGIPKGLNIGDEVSVFADTVGCCTKGLLKPSEVDNNIKTFLGNGILYQTRETIICNNGKKPSGVAVHMTDVISRHLQLSNRSVPNGWALLQNLPSIICTRILDPQPGEIILDMCSAPGNKCTHISALMNGKGTLIALERNKSKINKLRSNCDTFSSGNVKIFCYDSTKAFDNTAGNWNIDDGPPFRGDNFDRILLDSPCSGLGQRPQLLNKITDVQLRSYIFRQRKLLSTAILLLKPKGILVYSTCTITVAENEGNVDWVLRKHPHLKLKSIKDHLDLKTFTHEGYNTVGLSKKESECLFRIGPEQDSIGFFVACFIKLRKLL
ncbi:hypothetical protein M0802_002770 [Mischocyttarus mexicanus]|nr:hypothetical protein M0802_002770 [Mischocyttarus mexicanus]